MGTPVSKLIHYNPRLQHQVDHARALSRAGFQATSLINVGAYVHAISGPWYAYDKWKGHPRTLMIDRAFWGDPEYVSIGWLEPDGSRTFAKGEAPRPKPEFQVNGWKQPWGVGGKDELSCLVLADFNQDIEGIVGEAREHYVQVEVRRHPADQVKGTFDSIPLDLQVTWYDCVIATSGTAAFTALQKGVPVICLDARNPLAPVCASKIGGKLYRGGTEKWLHDLSYAQWRVDELPEAWELLKEQRWNTL